MDQELTAEDIKQLQAALPIIRALASVEPLLRKTAQAKDLLGDIKRLETQKAGLAGQLSAERAASTRDLEAALEQTRKAAEEDMARQDAVNRQKIVAAEGRLESLRRDEERLRDGMAQVRLKLEGELAGLRETIRAASEASAKELEGHRAAVREAKATLARDHEVAEAEKRKLEQDLAALRSQKQDIADRLKAALG